MEVVEMRFVVPVLLMVLCLVLLVAVPAQTSPSKQYQHIGLALTLAAPDPAYSPLVIPLGDMKLRTETAGPYLLKVYLPRSKVKFADRAILLVNTRTHRWRLMRGKNVILRSK